MAPATSPTGIATIISEHAMPIPHGIEMLLHDGEGRDMRLDFAGETEENAPDYPRYTKFMEGLEQRYGHRGAEIAMAVRESVINYAEHRNKFAEGSHIRVYAWDRSDEVVVLMAGDGPYVPMDFNRLRLKFGDEIRMGTRGRGHAIMAAYADQIVYDDNGGIYLRFKVDKEKSTAA
jgi:anti-sigma regulatory factor (Ser/Thr protein kinase)